MQISPCSFPLDKEQGYFILLHRVPLILQGIVPEEVSFVFELI